MYANYISVTKTDHPSLAVGTVTLHTVTLYTARGCHGWIYPQCNLNTACQDEIFLGSRAPLQHPDYLEKYP